jgi:hypothetical protein
LLADIGASPWQCWCCLLPQTSKGPCLLRRHGCEGSGPTPSMRCMAKFILADTSCCRISVIKQVQSMRRAHRRHTAATDSCILTPGISKQDLHASHQASSVHNCRTVIRTNAACLCVLHTKQTPWLICHIHNMYLWCPSFHQDSLPPDTQLVYCPEVSRTSQPYNPPPLLRSP